MKYTTALRLPADCRDPQGNLHPRTVLEIFQKIAGDHAEQLGVGFDAMLARNLLWVVTQTRYQVCGGFTPEQEITAVTWPLPPNRIGFGRDYLITAADGAPLLRGTSTWVVIDAETRRLSAVRDLYPEEEYYPDRTFQERCRRLPDFEAPPACRIIPDAQYIDRNGHVNNTCYAAFAETAAGGFSGKIDTFQIDYIHEVLADQPLTLFTAADGDTLRVKGESADGVRMFACAASFK